MKTKSSDAQHKPPYIFFPMNHVSIKKWLQFRKNGQVVILVGVRLGTCIKGSLFEPLCGYLTLCVVYLRQDTLSVLSQSTKLQLLWPDLQFLKWTQWSWPFLDCNDLF